MNFIFEVHIKPGYSAEQYAKAWIRASELIQKAPGAQGTRLHRKIGNDSILLAIATWESKQARDAIDHNADKRIAEIIQAEAEFVEIVLIGEFDAPEWEVLPDG
ncbi:MAG: antibiotic biosynthesis monooxygenase [Pseudomonadales bacterium]